MQSEESKEGRLMIKTIKKETNTADALVKQKVQQDSVNSQQESIL